MLVMYRDMRDVIKEIDIQIREVLMSDLSVDEKKERKIYLESVAKDNIFGNSKFRDLHNGRRVFDYVWKTVWSNAYARAADSEFFEDTIWTAYLTFCISAFEFLETARISQEGFCTE